MKMQQRNGFNLMSLMASSYVGWANTYQQLLDVQVKLPEARLMFDAAMLDDHTPPTGKLEDYDWPILVASEAEGLANLLRVYQMVVGPVVLPDGLKAEDLIGVRSPAIPHAYFMPKPALFGRFGMRVGSARRAWMYGESSPTAIEIVLAAIHHKMTTGQTMEVPYAALCPATYHPSGFCPALRLKNATLTVQMFGFDTQLPDDVQVLPVIVDSTGDVVGGTKERASVHGKKCPWHPSFGAVTMEMAA